MVHNIILLDYMITIVMSSLEDEATTASSFFATMLFLAAAFAVFPMVE